MAASHLPSRIFKGSMDIYASLDSQKRESPAAERNKQPILDVLLEFLQPAPVAAPSQPPPPSQARPSGLAATILEVASGSGQHVSHFAPALPNYSFQPSDVTNELFGSITAYSRDLPNVRLPPLVLDMSSPDWPSHVRDAVSGATGASAAHADARNVAASGPNGAADGAAADGLAAMVCINMCHISPLEATLGMLRGAGQVLARGSGLLFVYGPFTRDGAHTSDSNAAFHASLRARNPAWGYRDLAHMAAWAGEARLQQLAAREMPANNFMLVFRRMAD